MTLAQQALSRCDDCNMAKPLKWWGRHIRICAECRKARDDAGRTPQP